jgi:hypothetical protein
MQNTPMKVTNVTPRPNITAPTSRGLDVYKASAARTPAPTTHGIIGTVSQKSNVAHAQMQLPKMTAAEATASTAEPATRTLY